MPFYLENIAIVGQAQNTPVLKHSSLGMPYTDFLLKATRPKEQGVEDTYFKVVCFGENAQVVCKLLCKGARLGVQGKVLQEDILDLPQNLGSKEPFVARKILLQKVNLIGAEELEAHGIKVA